MPPAFDFITLQLGLPLPTAEWITLLSFPNLNARIDWSQNSLPSRMD
jgi:hypothetical protein